MHISIMDQPDLIRFTHGLEMSGRELQKIPPVGYIETTSQYPLRFNRGENGKPIFIEPFIKVAYSKSDGHYDYIQNPVWVCAKSQVRTFSKQHKFGRREDFVWMTELRSSQP